MPFDAPFKLGPFVVDCEGRLQPGDPAQFPTFGVTYGGCQVQARLAAEDAGSVVLRSVLGRVPSTAEGDGALRAQALAVLRPLEALLPAGWQIDLLADHRVGLRAVYPLEMPTTAIALVSVVTGFLLALGPYLDVLVESGVGRAAAGTVNTWPG